MFALVLLVYCFIICSVASFGWVVLYCDCVWLKLCVGLVVVLVGWVCFAVVANY